MDPTAAPGPPPTVIEVVPSAVADAMVAEATAAILELERELEEVQQAAARDAGPLDEAAHFLLEQAAALVSEAQAHRARAIEAARAEAATIIGAIPTPTNGQR